MTSAKLIKKTERVTPQAKYQIITPSQAQLWLDQPAKNRNVMQRRVEAYAAAMLRGDWMLTNQGIAFDENGALIDGQHRLLAIVKAQIPIEMLVVHATSNRSQLVLDQGAKRSPHDQIGLREGWQIYPIHTAIAKAMMVSVGGVGDRQRQLASKDIQLLDRFYVKHHKAIEFVVDRTWTKKGSGNSLKGVIIAPVLAPVARAHYTVDVNKLEHFCAVLASGMGEGHDDSAVIVLRNWLIAGRDKALSSRAGKDRFTIYKKTELALRAFLNGESIQRLGNMVLEQELFPIPGNKLDKVVEVPKPKKQRRASKVVPIGAQA